MQCSAYEIIAYIEVSLTCNCDCLIWMHEPNGIIEVVDVEWVTASYASFVRLTILYAK